jgi:hypothetical protein
MIDVPVNLAAELTNPNIWYPTILGVLVVVAAVILFVGSVYLLLGTNLGARLGFLVTFTGLAGFMMILTLLWTTSATPLTVLKGRVPQWKVVEVVPNVEKAKTEAVRDAVRPANAASSTDASNIKSAVDAALVTKVATPTVEVGANDNRFAKFQQVTDYMVLNTYVIGGSNPRFYRLEFTHTPKYAVVSYCKTATQTQTFGLPPLPPECATGADAGKGFVVLQYDLGSVRFPPFIGLVISTIAFGLGLLMLHWREKDIYEAQAAEAAAKAPKPAPAPDDSELAKV